MPSTYASLRTTQAGVTFAATSGGSLSTGGTVYLSAVSRSRQGWNLLSSPVAITYSAGQKIVCTLASTARSSGDFPHEIIIAGSLTNSVASMQRLASWKALDDDQVTRRSLPTTIELTTDAHIALGVTIANPAALPSGSNLKRGMVRLISSLTKYAVYDDEATAGLVAASAGYWVEYYPWSDAANGFTVYVGASTELPGGCDRALQAVPSDDIIPPPQYEPNPGSVAGGNSTLVPCLYQNGLTEDGGSTTSKGETIGVVVSLDGKNVSDRFSQLLFVKYKGLVRKSTGVLNTSSSLVGVETPIYMETIAGVTTANLTFPEDVPRGYGALFDFYLRFAQDQQPFDEGSKFGILFYPQGRIGQPNPAIGFTGSIVLPTGNRLRIVPDADGSVRRLDGAAGVLTQGQGTGYSYPDPNERTYTGLTADTAGQKVLIAATTGLDCRIVPAATTPLAVEDVRAIVGTTPGTYTASGWSSPVSVSAGQSLTVTVTHPCSSAGKGTVRANYADAAIRGDNKGSFNVPKLRVFVRKSGTIYELAQENAQALPTQTIVITSIGSTTIGSLPTNADNTFCLFGYSANPSAAASSGGSLASGSYEVSVAYHYPTSNTRVTSISHSQTDGCIPEASTTLARVFVRSDYWAEAVLNSTALAAVTPSDRFDGQTRRNLTTSTPFTFNAASTSTPSSAVVLPDDLTTSDPGRWLETKSNQVFSGTIDPDPALGQVGDVYDKVDETSATLTIYTKTGVTTWTIVGVITAPQGPQGNPAYTTTTGSFVQPSIGSTVSVPVSFHAFLSVGQYCAVETGGIYQVDSFPDSTHISLLNIGNGNAAPGTTIGSGSLVSAAGKPGNPAYTNTTASFTQPSVSASVTVAVPFHDFLEVGQYVYVATGGAYQVFSFPDATHINLVNTGASGNASPGDAIASGSLVTASGPPGSAGGTGPSGTVTATSGVTLQEQSSAGTAGANEILLQNINNRLTWQLESSGTQVYPLTQGKQTIYVPAGAIEPRKTNGCASLDKVETTTGRPDIRHLAFDPSTVEYGQFEIDLPKSWNLGTLTAQFVWTGIANGSGDVVWGIQAVAQSNGDTIDVAYGTAVTVTDTFTATKDRLVTSETSAFTVAGTPATGDSVCFQIYRNATSGSDTRNADANLIGVRLFFTTDKENDA